MCFKSCSPFQLLTLLTTNNHGIRQQKLDTAANILNAGLCDPHLRQVMTVVAIPDLINADDSYVYVMLQISGKCNDCDSNIELFDKGAYSLAKSRHCDGLHILQGGTYMSLLCLCPSDVPRHSSMVEGKANLTKLTSRST
jgi:hypothetical protein